MKTLQYTLIAAGLGLATAASQLPAQKGPAPFSSDPIVADAPMIPMPELSQPPVGPDGAPEGDFGRRRGQRRPGGPFVGGPGNGPDGDRPGFGRPEGRRPGHGRPGQDGPGMDRERHPRPRGLAMIVRIPQVQEEIGLTEEQIDSIKADAEARKAANEGVRDELKALHEELKAAITGETDPTEEDVTAIVTEITAVKGAVAVDRALHEVFIRSVLTTEQEDALRTLIEERRENRPDRRERPGMGRRPGGDRPGGDRPGRPGGLLTGEKAEKIVEKIEAGDLDAEQANKMRDRLENGLQRATDKLAEINAGEEPREGIVERLEAAIENISSVLAALDANYPPTGATE